LILNFAKPGRPIERKTAPNALGDRDGI